VDADGAPAVGAAIMMVGNSSVGAVIPMSFVRELFPKKVCN
jgi:hypothetical protein